MKVFIDTNAYLSFLGVDPNLPALLEFKKLLSEKNPKIELLVTQQLFDEYERNAGTIMESSRQQLAKETFNLNMIGPEYIKKVFQNDVDKMMEKAELLKKEKIEKLEKGFFETEEMISNIFSLGTNLLLTNELIEKAKERCDRGNPPRKIKSSPDNNTSYGDAINWESILANVNEDLVIVSNDPDYAELFRKEKIINRFLKKEWDKKNKTIKLYSQLGIFINTLEEEQVISEEAIEKEIKSSDLISITKPLAYHIIKTEEQVFPISGATASVFSNMPNYIGVNENSYFSVASDIANLTEYHGTNTLRVPVSPYGRNPGTFDLARGATSLSDLSRYEGANTLGVPTDLTAGRNPSTLNTDLSLGTVGLFSTNNKDISSITTGKYNDLISGVNTNLSTGPSSSKGLGTIDLGDANIISTITSNNEKNIGNKPGI